MLLWTAGVATDPPPNPGGVLVFERFGRTRVTVATCLLAERSPRSVAAGTPRMTSPRRSTAEDPTSRSVAAIFSTSLCTSLSGTAPPPRSRALTRTSAGPGCPAKRPAIRARLLAPGLCTAKPIGGCSPPGDRDRSCGSIPPPGPVGPSSSVPRPTGLPACIRALALAGPSAPPAGAAAPTCFNRSRSSIRLCGFPPLALPGPPRPEFGRFTTPSGASSSSSPPCTTGGGGAS